LEKERTLVIPAKAGIQRGRKSAIYALTSLLWIPAFAGMTGLITLSPLPALAKTDLQAELAAKQAVHQETSKKAGVLNAEVGKLKAQLIDTSKNLRATEETLAATTENLNALRQKRTQHLENIYRNENALSGLLAGARNLRASSTPTILMKEAPVEAARAAVVMKSMIPVLHTQSSYLKAQLAELAGIEAGIASQLEARSVELQKLGKQEAALSTLLEERQKSYKKTEAARKTQEEEMAALAKEAKNVKELMGKIKQKSQKQAAAAALPLNTPLPVTGSIRTGFGEKDDMGAESEGITFTTRPGASVVSPLAGTVRFAGPFQKFRQILIVEHPGGYHSLIAGLGRIDTVVGAALATGEPVGTAEFSSHDVQVYYELRQNGKPVNPRKLTVAQRKQEKI
jgi:murein hydrolase activator